MANKLKNVTILNGDFEAAIENAKEGDFVYFDSPYDDTFSDYQKGGFPKEEHKRLAALCKKLTEKKVYFLLSSSDSEFIRDLYSGFSISVVEVTRMIRFRGKATVAKELFICNY